MLFSLPFCKTVQGLLYLQAQIIWLWISQQEHKYNLFFWRLSPTVQSNCNDKPTILKQLFLQTGCWVFRIQGLLHAPWYFCSQVVHQPSLIRVKEWHQCFKGRTTNSGQGVYLLRLTRFIFWFLFQLLVKIVFLLGKKYGKLMLNTLSFFPSNSGIQGAQGLINS
jgi:hypothetical protein